MSSDYFHLCYIANMYRQYYQIFQAEYIRYLVRNMVLYSMGCIPMLILVKVRVVPVYQPAPLATRDCTSATTTDAPASIHLTLLSCLFLCAHARSHKCMPKYTPPVPLLPVKHFVLYCIFVPARLNTLDDLELTLFWCL